MITGVSSGIGLTTARMAAERGAKLVLAARSEDALRELTAEITENGGEVEFVAERSPYTQASIRSALPDAALVGLGLTAAALYVRDRLTRRPDSSGRGRRDASDSEDDSDGTSLGLPRL